LLPGEFRFHQIGLGDQDGTVPFIPPANPDHVSYRMCLAEPDARTTTLGCAMRRLSTLMAKLQHDRIDVLKLDIEGAEYAVLENMLEMQILPTQVLVEFHHRPAEHPPSETRKALRALRGKGYCMFSVAEQSRQLALLRRDTGEARH
jgi:hypothetical protein